MHPRDAPFAGEKPLPTRYYWELLGRASACGMPIPAEARAAFEL